jgi:hypothetical protein
MMPELIEHRFMNRIFYTLSFFCMWVVHVVQFSMRVQREC